MLKNDTLKNGTSGIGLYGSAPPPREQEQFKSGAFSPAGLVRDNFAEICLVERPDDTFLDAFHVFESQGGTCQNFDRDARPTFLGLKFGQILFFWVGKFFSYFSGFCKISAILLGLTNFQLFFWVFQFLCHTLESFA